MNKIIFRAINYPRVALNLIKTHTRIRCRKVKSLKYETSSRQFRVVYEYMNEKGRPFVSRTLLYKGPKLF